MRGKYQRFKISITVFISITAFIVTLLFLNHNNNINKLSQYAEIVEDQQLYITQLEYENSNLKYDVSLERHNNRVLQIRYDRTKDKLEEISTIPAVVTSYAPLDPNAIEGMCYSGDPNITGTGTQARVGIAATDWNEFPVGTILDIPGYGEAIVEDTGGAMRGYNQGFKIDILHETREESFAWGVQELDIKVVGMVE